MRSVRFTPCSAALLMALAGCGYNHHNGCYGGCPGGPAVTLNTPNSIAIADVNGDGVPDLVVADGAGFTLYRGEAVRP